MSEWTRARTRTSTRGTDLSAILIGPPWLPWNTSSRPLSSKKSPLILDLMAGPDSHLPSSLNPAGVVGLGLNENELQQNPALTEHLFHDLNENPRLPFEDNTFDAIINTVSVDYLTRPADVFSEAARVIKPRRPYARDFQQPLFPRKSGPHLAGLER